MKNRNIKIKSIFFVLVATSLSFGCSKINDINTSPNNPPIEKATPQVLFPSGVMSTAGMVGGELDIIGGIWSQYWTQSPIANQFKTIDSYNLQRQDFNGGYDELFSGALADYQLAISKAKDAKLYNFYLMSTVMKAYTYEVLVDLYDQVPYTEAFQGAAKLNPKFDDGFTVYKGLIAEINAALATDYAGAPFVGTDANTDFLFGGDMDKWRQFANTLKLKMYLRMVNTHAADGEAGIRALYAANADFLSVDAGVKVFTDATDQRNPIFAYTVFNLGGNDLRASKTLVSWLTENNDPRAKVYFGTDAPTPVDQGNYTAPQSAQPSYYAATAPAFKATDPVYFLTAAESHFLQAEAGARYGVTAAGAAFTAGVNAAFAQYALTAPTTGVYAYPNGTLQANLKAIIYQKWASFPNSHALEGFFDQQRTGYPEVSTVYSLDAAYIPGQWVYSKNGVTGGRFPKRLVFPDSERSRNSSTPAEVPITTPVWWGQPNK
jgi:hypothetical protein